MTFHFDFEPIKVEYIKDMYTIKNTGHDLRDRFAELVLAQIDHRELLQPEDAKIIAEFCYQAADAMMAAREKPTEEKPSKPKVLNVNDTVRVKLTDHGRAVHAKDYANFCSSSGVTRPYTPPKEDADGWSTWQFWHLLQTFSPYIGTGFTGVFETDIEVVE